MIKPTVGRVVWFTPPDNAAESGFTGHGGQPCAAIVAYVWSDSCVNLHVIDHNGNGHSRTSVPLLQDGDARPGHGYFCEWMPYQKGQAAKAEQLEKRLGAPASDQAIEQEIQAKGLTAPRVTPQRIEEVIASEHYFTAFDGAVNRGEVAKYAPDWEVPRTIEALGLLTFCVLVLKNGFTVTGESACASPENFDAELGRKIARQHAMNKIWPLEGYLLRQRLATA